MAHPVYTYGILVYVRQWILNFFFYLTFLQRKFVILKIVSFGTTLICSQTELKCTKLQLKIESQRNIEEMKSSNLSVISFANSVKKVYVPSGSYANLNSATLFLFPTLIEIFISNIFFRIPMVKNFIYKRNSM